MDKNKIDINRIGKNKLENNKNKFIGNLNGYMDGRLMGDIIFPIILVLVGMCKVGRGFDISDTGYNYGNYVNLTGLDNMWFCSTFLANIVGRLFTFLPYGHTLIGLNIYTGLIKCAIVLASYFFFRKKVGLPGGVVFFGELIAVSLCWCPTALIYNYLSYLLFFLGAMFLYRGLTTEKNRFLIIAGVFLGVNIFVRFPNICEMGLIAGLWYWCFIKKCKFIEYLKKTGWCVAGYTLGAGVMVAIIEVTRGFDNYILAIKDLFSMTDEATQYSGGGMINGILMAYKGTIYFQKYILIVFVMAFIIWLVAKKMGGQNIILAAYAVITALMVALGYFLYKVKLFDFNYHDYNSIYGLGACMMGLAILILMVPIFIKKVPDNIRLLCALSIIIIGITPLGTNNALYANYNNLFIVLPVMLYIVCIIPDWKGMMGVKWALALYICLFTYQCLNFGFTFTFRDGFEMSQDTYVSIPSLVGVATQENKAKELEELGQVIVDEKMILTYGDVPGAGFYFDKKPAFSSSWPSLPSFSVEKFTREIEGLQNSIAEGTKEPYIAVDPGVYERLSMYEEDDSNELAYKELLLYNFIKDNGYEVINPDSNLMVVYDVR